MSIDIRITQKGLRKRTLPLEVITGGTLVYGSGDGTKFEEGNLEGEEILLYHPQHVSQRENFCGSAGGKSGQCRRLTGFF